MNQALMLAKTAAGWGKVALYLGVTCQQYRPAGTSEVITPGNLVGPLAAFFSPSEPSQEQPQWIGQFDFSGSLPGDYLVTPSGVSYFIGTQQPFLPIICVQTNSIVSLVRPAGISGILGSGYSGVVISSDNTLLESWPASLLAAGKAKQGELPDDEGLGVWVLLLPALPVTPAVADLVTDGLRRCFVVTAAEVTSLGWQLHVKQVSS